MMKFACTRLLSLILLISAAQPAGAQQPVEIPDIAQALLDAAYKTGDPDEVAAVARAVREVFPDYEPAITAQSDERIAALTPPEEVEPEEPAKPEGGYFAIRPWEGKIQAGASYASGNSDNLAIGIKLDAARTAGDFVHNFKAFLDYSESNDITNQDRWGASYKLDYKFNPITYAYGRISYENDSFSGYDYRLFVGAGLGHFLYDRERFVWKVEAGPGYRYSPVALSDEIEKQFAAYASSEINWIIREGVTFDQDFNLTWTSPSTTYQSITGLTTVLTESISMGIEFEYRYETNPPMGRFKSDEIARATLVYGF